MSVVSLAIGLGIVAMLLALAVLLDRRGRTHERALQMGQDRRAADKALEIERDLARESDPVKRLRDEWRRPVSDDKTDSRG